MKAFKAKSSAALVLVALALAVGLVVYLGYEKMIVLANGCASSTFHKPFCGFYAFMVENPAAYVLSLVVFVILYILIRGRMK